ncbi:MAG: phosphatase PAP2 family protein [Elusimicrobia bacterium]|nr:phosphatase PAP2 family protein [Elusimicrobiota bacterium]
MSKKQGLAYRGERIGAVLAAFFILFSSAASAQEISSRTYTLKDGSSLSYAEPGLFKTLGSAPADFGAFVADSFKKEKLPWLAAITASTLVLMEYDRKIYDHTRKLGKKIGISSEDKSRTFIKIGGMSILDGPTDAGSAMYFLGDGWVALGLFGGFETYGRLKGDWRARQTGYQLAEGLIVTGFATQALKHVTGREEPGAAAAPRAVWRFFPGFGAFSRHRSRYDAFPSGHMATGMMTITVIAENYPEKKYVKPVGYTLLCALGFQMINNGAHWSSDYPLGLAVGYGVGRAIAYGGRTAARRAGPKDISAVNVTPYISPEGAAGAAMTYKF